MINKGSMYQLEKFSAALSFIRLCILCNLMFPLCRTSAITRIFVFSSETYLPVRSPVMTDRVSPESGFRLRHHILPFKTLARVEFLRQMCVSVTLLDK